MKGPSELAASWTNLQGIVSSEKSQRGHILHIPEMAKLGEENRIVVARAQEREVDVVKKGNMVGHGSAGNPASTPEAEAGGQSLRPA
jgi:hypothetical protein